MVLDILVLVLCQGSKWNAEDSAQVWCEKTEPAGEGATLESCTLGRHCLPLWDLCSLLMPHHTWVQSCHQHCSSLQGQGWERAAFRSWRFSSVICSLYSQLSGKRDEKLLQNLFVTLKLYSQVPPYCVAWPREVYCSGIYQQWRDGVSLVQFSADTCSLPVENLYPYLYLM